MVFVYHWICSHLILIEFLYFLRCIYSLFWISWAYLLFRMLILFDDLLQVMRSCHYFISPSCLLIFSTFVSILLKNREKMVMTLRNTCIFDILVIRVSSKIAFLRPFMSRCRVFCDSQVFSFPISILKNTWTFTYWSKFYHWFSNCIVWFKSLNKFVLLF